jgi:glycosyltransferase involved in cell wall biosynthesis
VDDGRTGAIVPPGDAVALAQSVARLRALSPAEVTDAARRAAEPFTYARQAEEFERLYREIP